jgi:hypothetical protein
VIIDRELPGRGSTVASTSMLLWEIDRSLTQLTEIYGFEALSQTTPVIIAIAHLSDLNWDWRRSIESFPALRLLNGVGSRRRSAR